MGRRPYCLPTLSPCRVFLRQTCLISAGYSGKYPDLDGWEFWAGSPEQTSLFGGRSRVLWWDRLEVAVQAGSAFVRGKEAWGRKGVAVRQIGTLPATLYTGDKFDTNVAVILPNRLDHLSAIWAFCSSSDFNTAVRRIDPTMNVTNATFVKVPFDLERWQTVAEEQRIVGLPRTALGRPYSVVV